jgi:hypothetical protein
MSDLNLNHITPTTDIYINQGHQWTKTFKLKDQSGAVFNLTGASITGHVKHTKEDPIIFSFVVDINLVDNEFTMTIPHNITAAISSLSSSLSDSINQFVFDWTLTDSLGLQYKILKGRILIDKEVTVS